MGAAGLTPSAQSPKSPTQLAEELATVGYVGNAATLTVSGGANFAFGEVGYLHTDGTVRKALATSEAAAFARCLCIAAAGVASGSSGLFLVAPGIVTFPSAVGTIGDAWVDESTAGALATAPPSEGNFAKLVGTWLSTTVLHWHADPAVQPTEVYPT